MNCIALHKCVVLHELLNPILKVFCHEFKKSVQWKAYLRKSGIVADCPQEFKVIADFIASKMLHLLPR